MKSASVATNTDVVIVGGGPAGTAAALALAGYGVSVLVIERSGYGKVRVGETFPPAIKEVLAQLDLWAEFVAANHVQSVGIRSVWGGPEPYDRSFIFDAHGTGWHVDRRDFDAFLARSAERRGVKLERESQLLKCERNGTGGWKVLVGSRNRSLSVNASLVVDATGRACALARRLDSRRIAYDQLVGVYAFLEGLSDEQPFTLVEAVEDGWWYSAPLPGGRQVVAFMTDSDLFNAAALRDWSQWKTRLGHASQTKARVAQLKLDGTLKVLSANSSRLNQAGGPGWLAIGDAASAFDPLSGDGVMRALKSGLRATEIIRSCLLDQNAIPEYGTMIDREFRRYLQQRNAYYSRDNWWASSPLWSRRH
ncbi:MAG: NAD(P)/FAD-dependent oxidoreductase [Pyrinomonadaceae bacterium]